MNRSYNIKISITGIQSTVKRRKADKKWTFQCEKFREVAKIEKEVEKKRMILKCS